MTAPDKRLAYEVAQQLKRLRLEAGLSLDGLAQKSGLHRTSLGLIERGERRLTLASAKRLADALGSPLWTIVKSAEGTEDG